MCSVKAVAISKRLGFLMFLVLGHRQDLVLAHCVPSLMPASSFPVCEIAYVVAVKLARSRGRPGPLGPSQMPPCAALCRTSALSHRFFRGLRQASNLRVAIEGIASCSVACPATPIISH